MPAKIDMVGKRFGKLVVLEYARTNKSGNRMYLCQCDCGKTTVVSGASLRMGKTASCGCGMNVIRDLTGQRFGRLVVIEQVAHEKNHATRWLCQCDCGKLKIVQGPHLTMGKIRSCTCMRTMPVGIAALRALLRMYQASASKRGFEWAITEDQFRYLISLPCHYCGIPPGQKYSVTNMNGEATYNGLDRLDSSKGYTIDNVVPCCGDCNYGKMQKSVSDFLAWVERVHSHQVTISSRSTIDDEAHSG